jgi:two-component system, OmpR family, phosphate regulon sensor histidine kinase PhoR
MRLPLPFAPRAGSRAGFSIARQLRDGFVALVVLLAAAAAAIAVGTVNQYSTIDALASQVQPLQQANVQARASFASTQSGISVYMLTGNTGFITIYRQQRDLFRAGAVQLRRLAGPAFAANVRAQDRLAEAWFAIGDTGAKLQPGNPVIRRLISAAAAPSLEFYAANNALASRLAVRSRDLIADSRRSLATGLAWSGSLLLLAIGLALASSLRTIREITGPLRNLTDTLRQLTASEHASRAEVNGPAEVRDVARSVNALADEGDRLRLTEQQHGLLRAMARDAGNRIREHLKPEDVIREAHTVIHDQLGCDLVYLHLLDEGTTGGPEHYDPERRPPLVPEMPDETIRWAREMARNRDSFVIRDLRPLEEGTFPSPNRQWLLDQDVVSGMVVPLATGSELLGILTGWRTSADRSWTAAEIDAFESIAEDVARGLRHARLYDAENRLVADLKELDQARSDFLTTVSHELRTPLTSITGYVELLQEGDAGTITPAQDQMLDTIHRNAAALWSLIENVLTISTVELGSTKAAARPVDLTVTIDAAIRSEELIAETGQVTLAWEAPARPIMVKGDASKLDRVLMNLLSNAVKFTPPGGKVTVSAAADDHFAMVRVADTGIGIPEKDKKDLFGRFFRASNVIMRAVPGTGLGLSVCRALVTGQGGDLDLQSHEGVGTTVTVRLPLTDERENRDDGEQLREPLAPGQIDRHGAP